METITIIAGTLNVVILAWLLYSVRNLNVKVGDIDTLTLDIVDIQDSMDIRFEKSEQELDRRVNRVHDKMHGITDDLSSSIERVDDKLSDFDKLKRQTERERMGSTGKKY